MKVYGSRPYLGWVLKIKYLDNEVQTSYDVTTLFTSISIDGALEVVKDLLEKNDSCKKRTCLNAMEIWSLLEFFLNTTYFKFRGQLYQQDHGCATGLPVSPIIANLYIKDFEQKVLGSTSVSVKVWYRYVDDTHVVINKDKIQEFTDHINR